MKFHGFGTGSTAEASGDTALVTELTTEYGNVSAASIGAILRGLLALETQGVAQLFGEPMLNIDDLMQTVNGRGVVNILAADRLVSLPEVSVAYANSVIPISAVLFVVGQLLVFPDVLREARREDGAAGGHA
jgi:hypothetical protein